MHFLQEHVHKEYISATIVSLSTGIQSDGKCSSASFYKRSIVEHAVMPIHDISGGKAQDHKVTHQLISHHYCLRTKNTWKIEQ